MQFKRCCFTPLMSFERIASRYRRPSKSHLEDFLVNPTKTVCFLENRFGFLILRALQIGVDEIVLAVQLIADFLARLGGLNGCRICGD